MLCIAFDILISHALLTGAALRQRGRVLFGGVGSKQQEDLEIMAWGSHAFKYREISFTPGSPDECPDSARRRASPSCCSAILLYSQSDVCTQYLQPPVSC